MKTRALIVGLGIVLVVEAAFSGPAAGFDPKDPLLQQLLAQLTQARLIAPPANVPGAAPALVGNLWPASPGGPLAALPEILARFGPLLGLPAGQTPLAQLPLFDHQTFASGQMMVLAAVLESVPYLSGGIQLQFGESGSLVGLSGTFRKPGAVTRGQLTPEQAVERALAELSRKVPGCAMTGDGTVQEYLADTADGTVQHQYQLDLTVGKPPRAKRVILGPSGDLVAMLDTTGRAVPDALVYPVYPQLDTGVVNLVDVASPPAWNPVWTIRGSRMRVLDRGTYSARSMDGHFTEQPSELPGLAVPFLEANCYYHLRLAYDFARSWGVPLDTYPRMLTIDVAMEPASTFDFVHHDNAFFNPNDWSVRFASFNLYHPTFPAKDASVAYHEFGHLVHRVVNWNFDWIPWAGGPWPQQYNEAWAVAEGFADFFSSAISGSPEMMRVFCGGRPPCLSREACASCTARNPCMRTAQNSLTYSQVAPCTSGRFPVGGASTMEFHDAGQAFSGACWELAQNFGRDVAARIVIDGLRRARRPTTFWNAAVGMMDAEWAIYGGVHSRCLGDILERREFVQFVPSQRDPLACRY